MRLVLGNNSYEFFNDISLSLKYNAIASQLGFKAYFDPQDESHKKLFKPLMYDVVKLYHEDELLFTGRKISSSFKSSAVPSLATFSGYSLTGVMEDCDIPISLYPIQFDGLSLKEITERLIKPFGISLVVDDIVKKEAETVYETVDADPSGSVRDFIVKLAAQRSIIVSSTRGGSLLFTKTKAGNKPIADLSDATEKTLTVNGQPLHSSITVISEADINGGNAGESEIKNGMIRSFRPRVSIQTSGKDTDTELAAKSARASELNAIGLNIRLDSWLINDKVIFPNNIISVKDPSLFLYKKTNFIIESVTLTGNEKEQVAVLECVLPEAHTFGDPTNIFG